MIQSNNDPYMLLRDKTESERLNLQHDTYKTRMGLLHPSIPTDRDDLRIADLATGTGIWLSDLSETLPSSCSFFGFDISNRQFPSTSSTPSNMSFHTQDLLCPFPPQYHSFFDVVQIRLIVLALKSDEWDVVMRNVLEILKPGGWLQWVENEISNFGVHPVIVTKPHHHHHQPVLEVSQSPLPLPSPLPQDLTPAQRALFPNVQKLVDMFHFYWHTALTPKQDRDPCGPSKLPTLFLDHGVQDIISTVFRVYEVDAPVYAESSSPTTINGHDTRNIDDQCADINDNWMAVVRGMLLRLIGVLGGSPEIGILTAEDVKETCVRAVNELGRKRAEGGKGVKGVLNFDVWLVVGRKGWD